MKKVTFIIASRRLEVDLNDDFANFLFKDLEANKVSLDRDIEISNLLQLYLKALYKDYSAEEQIKILLNKIDESN